MIQIFTEHITERLLYVLDFCFKSKGEDYKLYTNRSEWNEVRDKHISYGSDPLGAKIHIKAQGILFENEHYPNKLISIVDDEIAIDGVVDFFGTIFYYLSRYEEYKSNALDKHERFLSSHNSLVRLNVHKLPVLDIIVKGIWANLGLDYAPVKLNYNTKPSFDIDVAWAYKNRPLVRKIGGLVKRGKPIDRIKVLSGAKKDPYDTYDTIQEIGNKFPEGLRTFILLGDWGPYDKNIHWENKEYQKLIGDLSSFGAIGIHPSYGSHLNEKQIKTEIERLSEIVGKKTVLSRQHFLRMRIPETYTALLKNGVKEDYSMGFADQIGFRAGTSFSFPYFDIKNNRKTEMQIVPFCYMDSSLKDYLKWSPKRAMDEIQVLQKSISEVGGTFSFIWHNSSIHDTGEWKGWKRVLDFTIEETIK